LHCSACRAGHPSDCCRGRAARQQTRTRPVGGGPLLYNYAVGRLRHPRHRSRPHCGRAVPPAAHHPGPPLRPGRGAPPATTYRRVRNPPPPLPPAAAASRGRRRSGRCPCPVDRLTVPHVANCRVAARGDGSPDCIAITGPRAARPDVGGGGSAGAGAALAKGVVHYAGSRSWRDPNTVWGQPLDGPRATVRHPGLAPDSAQRTRITAGPAKFTLPRRAQDRAATGSSRARPAE
jgi:hypothetical protein